MSNCSCFIKILVVCIFLLCKNSVSGYKVSVNQFLNKIVIPLSVGAALIVSNPIDASAQVDCNRNCLSNCNKVAPGSLAYCKESCVEYCEQPDRQDGLSGSVDATKGETGLFGGSIDGTVVYGEDKPPKAFSLIPDFMLKVSSSLHGTRAMVLTLYPTGNKRKQTMHSIIMADRLHYLKAAFDKLSWKLLEEYNNSCGKLKVK